MWRHYTISGVQFYMTVCGGSMMSAYSIVYLAPLPVGLIVKSCVDHLLLNHGISQLNHGCTIYNEIMGV